MRKLFSVLVATLFIFGIATTAGALNESDYGPQNVTLCYITDMGAALTSGDAVVMQTSSPTYPGREVTGTNAVGVAPYGVLLADTDAQSAADKANGCWVKVLTHGYAPVNVVSALDTPQATATAGHTLVMAGRSVANSRLYANKVMSTGTASTSGSTVALMETRTGITVPTAATHPTGTRLNAFFRGL